MTRPVSFVILAGGKGERLWPLVRVHAPKVCASTDGRASLLASTIRRLDRIATKQDILLVATPSHAKPIRATLSSATKATLVLEPEGRNTAACIALAAARVAHRSPQGIMAVLPADHWIEPTWAFRRSLRAAIALADHHDGLITIGLPPTRIHTGLGHLCTGGELPARAGCRVFRLQQFVEKPSPQRAARLLRRPHTLWNAGMFIGRVEVFIRVIRQWLPEHAAQLCPSPSTRPLTGRALAAAYRRVPRVSFDDGVMAHLRNSLVVEGRFRWEDLGSWDSWVRMSRPHAPMVTIASDGARAVNVDGRSSRRAGPHLVAVVGVPDAIVVRTPDATLVCHTSQAQAVRHLVTQLTADRALRRYL